MNAVRLLSETRGQAIELRDGKTGVVGRAHDCDFPILDPSISRRHAEVSFTDGTLRIKDLGSSNGTYVNGKRKSDVAVKPGDVITFGRLEFTVRGDATPADAAPPVKHPVAETTIVRQVPVDALGDARTASRTSLPASTTREAQLHLIGIAKELTRTGDIDRLLERFADVTLEIMDVDCVSLLLLNPETNALEPRVSKSKFGAGLQVRRVPTSISNRVVGERIAILTDNAAADVRFKGSSIVVQSVRSAMCTPLMGRDGSVLGVFYVDNRTANQAFVDEDLSFLIAFAGIAAGAIEHRRSAKLASLTRHVAPEVATAISAREESPEFPKGAHDVAAIAAQLDGIGTLAEKKMADAGMGFLAHYTRAVTKLVFAAGGTIDRGIAGDILAFWGLPVPDAAAAHKALDTAKALKELVDRLNKRWLDDATAPPPVTLRMGLAYGTAVGENIGSKQNPEYGVVGRPIDVARRLCARAAPGETLVTSPLLELVATQPPADATEPLHTRGADSVDVYRLNL